MEDNKAGKMSLCTPSSTSNRIGSVLRRRSTLSRKVQTVDVSHATMVLPRSIRCNKCSSYMAKGTKFDSRKKQLRCPEHLKKPVFMLWFNCTYCKSKLSLKTNRQICYDDMGEMKKWSDFDGSTQDETKMVKPEQKGMEEIENLMACWKMEKLKI